MKYRQLGRTGLEVSEISIGCSGFWGNRAHPEADAGAVIRAAVDRGVNFFDTGHHYCNFNAEPRLGRILRPLMMGGRRDRLVISSKATDGGAASRAGALGKFRRRGKRDYSPDYIESVCRASISNLHCDYLDIFQLHGVTEQEMTEPLVERLLAMKSSGLFRFLGANTHSEAFNRFVSERPDIFDMVLIDYNVLQLDREAVISELKCAGVGVVAGTVLAQGHLVPGKIGPLRSLSDLWYLARARLKPASRRLGEVAPDVAEVLSSVEGMSPAQAAFAYVLANADVSSCVFGTTRVKNLEEAVEGADKRLSPGSIAAIRAAYDAMAQKISE